METDRPTPGSEEGHPYARFPSVALSFCDLGPGNQRIIFLFTTDNTSNLKNGHARSHRTVNCELPEAS